MPEKDPNAWALAWQMIPEPLKAAILSAGIALLRIMYDGKEPRPIRVLLECAFCGGISLAVFYGVEAISLPPEMGVFFGGAIGLVGADQVRTWARAVAQRRIEGMGGGK